MTIEIKITGENAVDISIKLKGLAKIFGGPGLTIDEIRAKNLDMETETTLAVTEPEKEKKPRKVKEEKVAEAKAEVLAPEKPKYTLQDAIDRAREIAGDGKDEKIMNALKGINTRLGISKVREIPPEKLDGYMVELEKEFPKDAAKPADANMFD